LRGAFHSAVSPVTNTLFTDITRSFEDILQRSDAPLTIEQDEARSFGGRVG
jgi:hypothetical protein